MRLSFVLTSTAVLLFTAALELEFTHDDGTRQRIELPAEVWRATGDGAIHDLHLTHSRVVVDGKSVLVRVRLFQDDLEKALRSDPRHASMTVASTPAVDSAFAAYFNDHVSITADGARLRGKVLQSGPDGDGGDQPMWWYLIELTAAAPVKTLAMRNALLFELFRDQRNIVTLLKMPGERRFALFFVPDEKKDQVIEF